jgi:hypothetical protein
MSGSFRGGLQWNFYAQFLFLFASATCPVHLDFLDFFAFTYEVKSTNLEISNILVQYFQIQYFIYSNPWTQQGFWVAKELLQVARD